MNYPEETLIEVVKDSRSHRIRGIDSNQRIVILTRIVIGPDTRPPSMLDNLTYMNGATA